MSLLERVDPHKQLLKKLKKDPKVRDPEALAAWIGRRVAALRSKKPGKKRKKVAESLYDRIVGETE